MLSAAMHYLTASYGGDPNDGPLVSGVYVLNVMPAAITAVANGVNLSYGQSIPTLTGSLSGVLAQDAGKVAAVYTTAASRSSAPGSYPISVSLSGASAGDYTLSLGTGSGTVTIGKAAAQITLAPGAATVTYGAAVILTASVAFTATVSSPTGTVAFMDGANLLGTGNLSAGTSTFTTTSLAVGSHSITAVYSGDANFVSIASSAISESILDFALSASSASYSGGSTKAVGSWRLGCVLRLDHAHRWHGVSGGGRSLSKRLARRSHGHFERRGVGTVERHIVAVACQHAVERYRAKLRNPVANRDH